jgi:hypothetical protein
MIIYEIIFINKKIHALGNPELSMLRFKPLFNRNSLFCRNLFIKTEPTPNPNSLIYRPENRPILGNDSSTF